jgi:hypothetical protein
MRKIRDHTTQLPKKLADEIGGKGEYLGSSWAFELIEGLQMSDIRGEGKAVLERGERRNARLGERRRSFPEVKDSSGDPPRQRKSRRMILSQKALRQGRLRLPYQRKYLQSSEKAFSSTAKQAGKMIDRSRLRRA